MAVLQSRYEIRAGEPAPIAAPAETLDFLLHAKTRRVSIEGLETSGLVVGPGYAPDQILLAASPRAKPGEYTVTLSATSETGEERQTTLAVVVQAQVTVPPGSTRPPVVLLNGWMTGFTNTCPIATTSATTFGNLAQYLVSDGVPVVYLFDNCAVDQGNDTIETLGADLGAFLNTIKYDSGAQVPQIDLVAHSMGGLIARAYLAGIQPNQTFLPPAPTLVRKLVLIATPNFGSFVAGNYVILALRREANPPNWCRAARSYGTWPRGTSAATICAEWTPSRWLATPVPTCPACRPATCSNNASDGLVSLTSASLGFAVPRQSCPPPASCLIATLIPARIRTSAWALSHAMPPESPMSPTPSHVHRPNRSLLPRRHYGLVFDWNLAGVGPLDLARLWGNVLRDGECRRQLRLGYERGGHGEPCRSQNGGDTGTIFYTDFASGTGALLATSQSLGTINCGSLALSLGLHLGGALQDRRGRFFRHAAGQHQPAGAEPPVPPSPSTARILVRAMQWLPGSGLLRPGSATAQALTVTSWQSHGDFGKASGQPDGPADTQSGGGTTGTDTIGIMVAAPSTIAVIPASLRIRLYGGRYGSCGAAHPDHQ